METTRSVIPGRPNRKLSQRVAEIDNLRSQGFTVADIHRTLTAQGMTIGHSSVRRECNELAEKEREAKAVLPGLSPSGVALPAHDPAPSPTNVGTATPTVPGVVAVKTTRDSGKSKADAFFDTYVASNPILDLLDRKRQNKQTP
jgi:hypothetical protein